MVEIFDISNLSKNLKKMENTTNLDEQIIESWDNSKIFESNKITNSLKELEKAWKEIESGKCQSDSKKKFPAELEKW